MTPELLPLTTATETLALIPVQALSWHQVQLPPGTLGGGMRQDRAAPRLRAVLEGLLEDRLLDEPAQLHFALQPGARAGAPVWVAVCDRAWLRDAVAALGALGRAPQRLVPEWAPDAATEELWITGTEDAPQAVWVDAHGVHHLPLPQTAGAGSAAWSAVRDRYALWAEPAVAALAEKVLGRQPHVQSPAQRWQRSAQSGWDLAQFDLSRRNPLLVRLQRGLLSFLKAEAWRPARWAVLAVALVHLVGLNAYAWHVSAQTQAQRDALRATLVGTFPQVKVVVDAPLQMERELGLLRQARGAASAKDLESMLGAIGQANALPPGSPTSLEYANAELRLGVPDFQPEQAAALDAQLRASGLGAQAEGSTVVVRTRGTP